MQRRSFELCKSSAIKKKSLFAIGDDDIYLIFIIRYYCYHIRIHTLFVHIKNKQCDFGDEAKYSKERDVIYYCYRFSF